MPSITKTALIDDALYWSPAPNTDGYPDRGPFGDPVEVKARWIDGQLNLDHANSSYMYIDRDVEAAGYVMKGTLDDLLPGNMTEYPNEADGLGAWAAHWQFDETLDSQDDGPSFVINDGEVKFGDGARDEALTNDGSDIYRNEIETATVVDLSDSSSWILGFWLKVQAPASPSGSPSISPSPSPSLSPSPSASDRGGWLSIRQRGRVLLRSIRQRMEQYPSNQRSVERVDQDPRKQRRASRRGCIAYPGG